MGILIYIYLLKDGEMPLYVGATKSPKQRMAAHSMGVLKYCKNKDNVVMVILEIIDKLDEAGKAEKKWILHFKSQGVNLLNKSATSVYSKIEFTISEKIILVKRIAEGDTPMGISESMGVGQKCIETKIGLIKKEYAAININNLVHIFHQRKLIK